MVDIDPLCTDSLIALESAKRLANTFRRVARLYVFLGVILAVLGLLGITGLFLGLNPWGCGIALAVSAIGSPMAGFAYNEWHKGNRIAFKVFNPNGFSWERHTKPIGYVDPILNEQLAQHAYDRAFQKYLTESMK